VHHGGVWASLLGAGAAAPHGFGRRLLPLLETSALLAHPATRHAAGSLIRALGPLLTEPEHAALEDRIFAVEAFFDLNDPEQAERAVHVRDRLLGCLTLERVQTEQVRARLAELAAAGAPALHEPMHVEDRTREFTFADHLAAEGVSDAEIPSSVRNLLTNLYDDVRRAGETTDDQRRQAARARLPGEIEAILTLTADEPLTGQLANLVDDLIVRAATMASPVVAPDSPAAPGLIDALGRVAGRASDRGERAVIGWTITPSPRRSRPFTVCSRTPGGRRAGTRPGSVPRCGNS
jgi:hypothetical protein